MATTELRNTKQAAEYLGLQPRTLDKWRSSQTYPLKFVKVGGRIRYRIADLEEFLQSRTHTGVPEPERKRRRRA